MNSNARSVKIFKCTYKVNPFVSPQYVEFWFFSKKYTKKWHSSAAGILLPAMAGMYNFFRSRTVASPRGSPKASRSVKASKVRRFVPKVPKAGHFQPFFCDVVAEEVLRFKAYLRKNQGKPFNHESYFSDKMVLNFMTTRIPSV